MELSCNFCIQRAFLYLALLQGHRLTTEPYGIIALILTQVQALRGR
jgi:hypothetical protein